MPPRTRAATPSDEKITIRKAGVTLAKAHTRLHNDSEWVLGVLVTGQQRDVVSVAGGLGREKSRPNPLMLARMGTCAQGHACWQLDSKPDGAIAIMVKTPDG